MYRLNCKMCGSPNILQYGNIYICQNCGTRYSANDVQKMMIVGNVDVSGSTVNINNTSRLNNLYLVARRARDNNNWIDAEKNYSMILIDDPYSWEATFYVVFSRAMECKIAEIYSAAMSIRDIESSVLGLIRANVNPMYYSNAINEIVYRSIQAAKILAFGAYRHYQNIDESIRNGYVSEYTQRRNAAINILLVCGKQIDSVFRDMNNIANISVTAWKAGLDLISQFDHDADYLKSDFINNIKKYDSVYANRKEIESKEYEVKKGTNASIGCGCLTLVALFTGIFVLNLYNNDFKSSQHTFFDDLFILFIVLCFIAAAVGIFLFIIGLLNTKESQEKLDNLRK